MNGPVILCIGVFVLIAVGMILYDIRKGRK